MRQVLYFTNVVDLLWHWFSVVDDLDSGAYYRVMFVSVEVFKSKNLNVLRVHLSKMEYQQKPKTFRDKFLQLIRCTVWHTDCSRVLFFSSSWLFYIIKLDDYIFSCFERVKREKEATLIPGWANILLLSEKLIIVIKGGIYCYNTPFAHFKN